MIQGISIGVNRPKTFVQNATPVEGVPYNYINTTNTIVSSGQILHNSPSLNIRFSNIDALGVNHDGYLNNVQPTDTLTIGPQSATIVSKTRIENGWLLSVNAWPALVDGTYNVTIFGPF